MAKMTPDTSVKISDWLVAEQNDNLSRENSSVASGVKIKCGQLVAADTTHTIGLSGHIPSYVMPYDWRVGGVFYGIALSDVDGGQTGAKVALIVRDARVVFENLAFEFPADATEEEKQDWLRMAKDALFMQRRIYFAQSV